MKTKLLDSKKLFKNIQDEDVREINYIMQSIKDSFYYRGLSDLKCHVEMFNCFKAYEQTKFDILYNSFVKNRKLKNK